MGKEYYNFPGIKSVANAITSTAEAFRNNAAKLQQEVDDLKPLWKDKVYQKYLQDFTQAQKDLTAIYKKMDNIQQYLNRVVVNSVSGFVDESYQQV